MGGSRNPLHISKGLAVLGQPRKESSTIEITITPLTPEERIYAYPQSSDITIDTGCVGYMNINAETGDQSWTTRYSPLYSDEFTADFDLVQKVFHFNDPATSFIHDRDVLLHICQTLADSSFGNGTEYGFRINTERFSYLMRHEIGADSTITGIYAYERKMLDAHMNEAQRGIRFITTDYKDLFTLPDGAYIRINHPNGLHTDRQCRYIDSTHVEIGNGLYHICEFSELMKQLGNTVSPRDPITPRQFEAIWDSHRAKTDKSTPKPKYKPDPQR